MKFLSYSLDGQERLAVVADQFAIDLNRFDPKVPPSLRAALRAGIALEAIARAAIPSDAPRMKIEDLTLLPPVTDPETIVCLGLNYYDHAKEGGREKPEYPWFFLRTPGSLIGDKADGALPKASNMLDYEAELAVIIGRQVPRHVSVEDANKYVFGYSCFNDLSVRDYQRRTPQWTIGKNFDKSGAFGPIIVTTEELPIGARGLHIQGRLNGKVLQDSNTDDMIWSVSEAISLLSVAMVLKPGDVIAMGTPSGVGAARTPPIWLKDGDMFEVEIERIGVLRTHIRSEA